MAMENGGLSATDALLLGNGGGFGGLGNGFEGLIYLAVIMAMFGGNGFGWGGNNAAAALGYENLATSNEVQRGFADQNMMANQRETLSAVTNGTAQTIAASTANATNAINAIKDGNAALIREFGNVETALTALSGKQQECCCNILQKIGETAAATDAQIARNNYDAAMRDAATNANFTAQIQSVKDMISQNKIETLQSQISQLQLQNATANVLRYPNQWTYNGGFFPPMQCGCGCSCNA